MPYVIAKCAVSLNGMISDGAAERLILSSREDLENLDYERSLCDAIVVGANTVRRDNPSLSIKSAKWRQARKQDTEPAKVTITRGGGFDIGSRFFIDGSGLRLVYCPAEDSAAVAKAIGGAAETVALENMSQPSSLMADLARRGFKRILVEGGSHVLTWLLGANAVDELQISIAPSFVAGASAIPVVRPSLPFLPSHRLPLTAVKQLGDTVLLTYRLKETPQYG